MSARLVQKTHVFQFGIVAADRVATASKTLCCQSMGQEQAAIVVSVKHVDQLPMQSARPYAKPTVGRMVKDPVVEHTKPSRVAALVLLRHGLKPPTWGQHGAHWPKR